MRPGIDQLFMPCGREMQVFLHGWDSRFPIPAGAEGETGGPCVHRWEELLFRPNHSHKTTPYGSVHNCVFFSEITAFSAPLERILTLTPDYRTFYFFHQRVSARPSSRAQHMTSHECMLSQAFTAFSPTFEGDFNGSQSPA